MPNRSVAAVVTMLTAVLLSSGLATNAAADVQPTPRGRQVDLPTSGPRPGSLLDARVRGSVDADSARSGRATRGPVHAMIELAAAPSSTAYAAALGRGRPVAARAGLAQRALVLASQRRVLAALGRTATKARPLYRTSAVYSGIAVATDARRLAALAALPGVKAVHLLTAKRMTTTSTVPLIGATRSWGASGTGAGVRIGIIDSGIDYTHADFGGPGTIVAYDAARAGSDQPPSYPVGGAVVGGVDLAGEAYDPDATLADGSPDPARGTPRPDLNPLDCEGHGTHVAGAAAGRGVTAAGATYAGPWSEGLDVSALRIGPGVAPGASLYAIKVFGCTGSSDLVTQALDWSADPNRDGDVSDRLDVVNLSLGGDFASPQDPDAVASDNLARLGTVVVASAGNAGDLQDAAGSPGSATRAISVAGSNDAAAVMDGLRVDAPAGIEPAPLDGLSDNVFGAELSRGDAGGGVAPYDWVGKGGVIAAPLVSIGSSGESGPGDNADGCDPYSSNDLARVSGKVVLLRWTDIGARRCGSAARGANAFDAGAVGVVLGDDVNSFTSGIAGDPRLPMVLVIKQGTDALVAALASLGGDVLVSLTDDLAASIRTNLTGTPEDPTDRIGPFSSRGFGTSRAVKPDVTAPGVTVFSAAVGTGFDGKTDSGTSMAAPHVAGVAALVRAAHRSWTVEQVKAAIIGTASPRVRPAAGGTDAGVTDAGGRDREGPARAGAGRVRADRAVATSTLAYGADGTGAVGLSFGAVAVVADSTRTRGLRVLNTGGAPRTYSLAYRPTVSTPGVRFSVSPRRLTVPAGSSAVATVTMRLTPSAMRRTLDPTMSADDGLRSYYADAGGAVVVAGPDGALTVPVYAAPRPASAMAGASSVLVGPTGNGALALVGKGLLQGSGPDPLQDPTVYASTVTALMLQGTSPRRPDCSSAVLFACTPFPDDRAGDLRYVGVASEIPHTRDAFNAAEGARSGYAYFGITAWGPWRTPASYSEFDVYVNTRGSADPELVLFNSRLTADSDTMIATLADLQTGQIIDEQPLNAAIGAFDTGLFHSDSMVLPLWLPALLPYLPKKPDGTLASTRVGYWVEAGTVQSGSTDAIASQSRPLSVDLRSPALRAAGNAGGPALNDDRPGGTYRLGVHRDLAKMRADAPQGLLLVHHQNLNGSRAQVVQVRGASTTVLRSDATFYAPGARVILTATVRLASPTAAAATGVVTFRDGARVLGRARLVKGVAVLRPEVLRPGRGQLQPRGVLLGKRSVTATFEGNSLDAPSRSAAIRLNVMRTLRLP